MTRQLKQLTITPELLVQFLTHPTPADISAEGIPADARIVDACWDAKREWIVLTLWCHSFQEVPDTEAIPMAEVRFNRKYPSSLFSSKKVILVLAGTRYQFERAMEGLGAIRRRSFEPWTYESPDAIYEGLSPRRNGDGLNYDEVLKVGTYADAFSPEQIRFSEAIAGLGRPVRKQ